MTTGEGGLVATNDEALARRMYLVHQQGLGLRRSPVRLTFGKSHWPFDLARPEAVDYDESRFPGTFAALESVLVLPWNERYTDEHVDYVARSVRQAAERLSASGA